MAATAKVATATRLTTDVITLAAIVTTIIVLAVGMIVAPFAIGSWYAFEYSGDLSVKTEQAVTGNRGRVWESPTAHPRTSPRPSVDVPVAMATPWETRAPLPYSPPPKRALGVRGVHKTRGGTLAPRVAGVERGNLGTQLGSRQEPGPTATQDRQRRLRSGHGRDDHGPGSRTRNGKQAQDLKTEQAASGHDAPSSRDHGGDIACHRRWPHRQLELVETGDLKVAEVIDRFQDTM